MAFFQGLLLIPPLPLLKENLANQSANAEDADNFGRFQWIIKESRPSDGQGWECGAVDDRGNSRFAIKIWFDGDDVADEDVGHPSPLFNIVP